MESLPAAYTNPSPRTENGWVVRLQFEKHRLSIQQSASCRLGSVEAAECDKRGLVVEAQLEFLLLNDIL
jgi:hypothetical protein